MHSPTANVFQVECRCALHLQAKQSAVSFISKGVIIPDYSFVFTHLFLTLFLLCNYLHIYTAFVAVICEHLWASIQCYPREFLWSSEKLQGSYDLLKVIREICVQHWKWVLFSDASLVTDAVKYLSVPQHVSFLHDIFLRGRWCHLLFSLQLCF